jgi:signal transduction histidine kinase
MGAAAAGIAHVIGSRAAATRTPGVDTWIIVALVLSSGLFMTAGILRLVKWRLERDAHSVLVGTALMVMGMMSLPLGGFARLFVDAENSAFIALAVHCVTASVAMSLIVRALPPADHSGLVPTRLVVGVLQRVALVLLLVLAVRALVALLAGNETLAGLTVSVGLSAGWCGVAAWTARQAAALPWARRTAPLFLAMGLAEALRALDLGYVGAWAFGSVLLWAAVAALATRSALNDLDQALIAHQHEFADLAVSLQRASGRAEEMKVWREQFTHDACNAFAGLRAAMTILERYDGQVDQGTTERLRQAAVREIGHLEHLLTRSSSQPCERLEVSEVVQRVAQSARVLGAHVSFQGHHAEAFGRPGDLAAVLKNLLVNAQTHAPGSRITILVTSDQDTVTVTVSDDGPGLTRDEAERAFERGYRGHASPGSGLGLFAARELMREQGGDLVLGDPQPGATFHLTLSTAPLEPHAVLTVRIPAQRVHSPAAAAPSHGASPRIRSGRPISTVPELR